MFKINEKAVGTTLPKFNFFEPGRSKVVCFTDMASTILSEQWYKDRKDDFNDAKVRIIIATTSLVKNKMQKIRNQCLSIKGGY